MEKVRFIDKGPDRIVSRDGRFIGYRETKKGGDRFIIKDHDNNDAHVGSAKGFMEAVKVTERYLREQKAMRDREEHDKKMAKAKRREDEERKAAAVATGTIRGPVPDDIIVDDVLEEMPYLPSEMRISGRDNPKLPPGERVFGAMAALADVDGLFTVSYDKLSKLSGVPQSTMQRWVVRFLDLEWLIKMPVEPGKSRANMYGFNLKKEQVHEILRNFPTDLKPIQYYKDDREQVKKEFVDKRPESSPKELSLAEQPDASELGIFVGKLAIRVSTIESRMINLENHMQLLTTRLDEANLTGMHNLMSDATAIVRTLKNTFGIEVK